MVSIVYPPGLNYEEFAHVTLTFEGTDNTGNTFSDTLSIDVKDGNDPPQLLGLPNTIEVLENATGRAR